MNLDKQLISDLAGSISEWSAECVVGLTDEKLTPAFYQTTKEYRMVWNDLLTKLTNALNLNEKATERDEIWLEDIVLDVVDLVAALENRDSAEQVQKLRTILLRAVTRYR